ncbi:MAG: sulfatase-like hydrolase/transferase, partial [Acidobacteria bacterium]|nr:sulfatase-like hydrolase/transferase [Acidobacteriota bacterium]
MDQGIGRIIKCLEDNGIDRNTMVVFLSDNGGCAEYSIYGGLMAKKTYNTFEDDGGPKSYDSYGQGWACASNTPFRYFKHYIHEGGISTPMIVYWPAGAKSDGNFRRQVGHIIDIMPTLFEAAGALYPKDRIPLEGRSLMPLLRRRQPGPDRTLFWEHEGNRAVRRGQWKLVAGFGLDWELYDLVRDRTETVDLAARHPDRVRKLSAQYERWALRCGVLAWRADWERDFGIPW